MSSALVVLIYLAALAIPAFLLYWFHARSWYWHVLSIGAALVLGFVPTPPEWKTPAYDVLFGSCFIFLMVWGIGGLAVFPAHHDHSHHQPHHP